MKDRPWADPERRYFLDIKRADGTWSLGYDTIATSPAKAVDQNMGLIIQYVRGDSPAVVRVQLEGDPHWSYTYFKVSVAVERFVP